MAATRYGPVSSVAVISDVHANMAALTAVLAEIEVVNPDLVVCCGDLTWGSEPDKAAAAMRMLGEKALFVRGNGERAVLELTSGERKAESPRESWVSARHGVQTLAFVAATPFSVVVDIVGLGLVRFCHGSPRSDIELVTPETPAERFAELAAGTDEEVLVTGHTHLQFDRTVASRRSVNPGSVGLPFHTGKPGTAYWALLGPDVDLRRTCYDVTASAEVGRRLGDPGAATIEGLLLSPPTPAEVCVDAEQRIFSG